MSTIDERIVSMRFNNGQFESGIKTSTDSLESLKKGLNLDGAKAGLDALDQAGKKFSLAGIADGVESISSKFTALSIVGITALTNIVNKAVDAGSRIAKSLTIDPIKAGFDEYELKMGSIQTILSNTSKAGTTLSEVTASLDELNTYADKTIYNFGDMTKNIGLFTNAGIGIEDATSMIKGFSNEAAASGTTAAGSAGAAYQLSQALSAGTIRLMDWRSLTNVGMGNKNMQNGIIEIANAMGEFEGTTITAKDAAADFNGSLEKNWLSADVMQNYLKIQAGELNDEQMKAIGLTGEQIDAFKKQQVIAEDAATKVRTWTQLLGTLQEGVGSGWSETFDILLGDFDQATEMWTNVNNALGPMIGAAAEARNALLQGWADQGGRDVLIEAMSNAFKGLMSIITPVKEAFREIFPPMTAETLVRITNVIRDFTAKLILNEETSDKLKRTFKGVFAILKIGAMVLEQVFYIAKKLFTAIFSGSGVLLDFSAKVGDFFVRLSESAEGSDGFFQFFHTIGDVLVAPIELLKQFGGYIRGLFGGSGGGGELSSEPLTSAVDRVKTRLEPLGALIDRIIDIWAKMGDVFKKVWTFFQPIAEAMSTYFSNIGDAITEAIQTMEFSSVLDAINVGLFAGLVIIVKKFLSGGMNLDFGGGFLESLGGIFEGLTGTLGAMQAQLKAGTLVKIATAVALLTVSVVALSMIDSAKLTSALTAMTVMFTQLFASMAIFEKMTRSAGFTKMPLVAASMILLSTAILILTVAVRALSSLSWEELSKGLTGVSVLLGAVAGAAKLLSMNSGGLISASLGMIVLATAIQILVSAVQDLSALSWEELSKGLVGVGTLLASLTLFTRFANANGGGMAQGAGLILLALAIKLLASSVREFGGMDVATLTKGLATITLVLAQLALFSKATQNASGTISTAIGLVILGAALKVIASAMVDFAAMSWQELAKGLVGVAGALIIIAAAMQLMPKNMIVSAVSLVIVAAALKILADVMDQMGGMSWEEIGKGMVVLAGSLIIIAGAMYLMTGALPGAAALIVVAAALTLLAPVLQAFGAMSWEEMGKGLLMLAGVFLVIGVAGLVLAPIVPVLLGLGLAVGLIGVAMLAAGAGVLAFALGLTALSIAGAAGAAAIVAIVSGLIGLIPLVIEQIGLGIIAFAQVIATAGPAITEAIVTVLLALIDAILTAAPVAAAALLTLLQLLLDTLVSAVPMIVDAGMKLIVGLLKGISDNIASVVSGALDVVTGFINGIADGIPGIIESGVNLIITFVESLADAIDDNAERMGAAGGDLAGAIIEGLIDGLLAGLKGVVNSVKDVATGAVNGIKGILGINSPSKVFYEIGKWTDQGLANGIDAFSDVVSNSATSVGEDAIDSLKKSVSGISDVVGNEIDAQPVIRPVLDLSSVKKNSSLIGGMLDNPSLSLASSYNQALGASRGYRENQEAVNSEFDNSNVSTTNVTYNQTNNSPKALSTIDVYRQTKNQISKVKGALTK